MIYDLDTYLSHYEALKQRVDQEINDMDSNPALMMEYTVSTLNRHWLLPGLPDNDLDFFRQYLFNRRVSALLDPMFTNSFLADTLKVEGDTSFLSQREPTLFCSFHYGTSSPVDLYLAQAGFDLYVPNITNNELTLTSTQDLRELFVARATNPTMTDVDEAITGAGQSMVRMSQQILIDMLLLLRQQKSMLFLLDANVGVSEISDRQIPLRFMGQPYLSQKGIAVLSFLNKTPIVPVVCYRDDNHAMTLQFGKPILPTSWSDRGTFVQESLQQCYSFLEQHIRARPAQWRSWYLVHKYMNASETPVFPAPAAGNGYRFNKERYLVCPTSRKNVVMDRLQYGYFPVSPSLGRYLSGTGELSAQVEQQLSPALLNDLVARHVLLRG